MTVSVLLSNYATFLHATLAVTSVSPSAATSTHIEDFKAGWAEFFRIFEMQSGVEMSEDLLVMLLWTSTIVRRGCLPRYLAPTLADLAIFSFLPFLTQLYKLRFLTGGKKADLIDEHFSASLLERTSSSPPSDYLQIAWRTQAAKRAREVRSRFFSLSLSLHSELTRWITQHLANSSHASAPGRLRLGIPPLYTSAR